MAGKSKCGTHSKKPRTRSVTVYRPAFCRRGGRRNARGRSKYTFCSPCSRPCHSRATSGVGWRSTASSGCAPGTNRGHGKGAVATRPRAWKCCTPSTNSGYAKGATATRSAKGRSTAPTTRSRGRSRPPTYHSTASRRNTTRSFECSTSRGHSRGCSRGYPKGHSRGHSRGYSRPSIDP